SGIEAETVAQQLLIIRDKRIQLGRSGGVVEWQDLLGTQPKQHRGVEPRVARQQRRVELVERVVGRMPPPAEAARAPADHGRRSRRARYRWLLRDSHQQRRDPNANQRLVSSPADAGAGELLPPVAAYPLAPQVEGLGHTIALG